MSDLTINLSALTNAPQAHPVTRVEAAERLQILAARVPTFVVRVEGLDTGETDLCYLSTARRGQDASTETKRALGREALEHVRIEVTSARPGVIWDRAE